MAYDTVMTTAAAMATATVMATGNAMPPLSRDLATTITTMTANDHLVGDAAVGAFGVVNDGDNVVGGRGPGGFNREDVLVLAAETAATLIVDNAKVAMLALTLLYLRLRTWLQERGRQIGVGQGQQQWAAAAAIMPTMRGQTLTMAAASCWAHRGAFDTAITAAADKRQPQEQMGLQQLIATALHNHFGQEIQNKPGLREEAQY